MPAKNKASKGEVTEKQIEERLRNLVLRVGQISIPEIRDNEILTKVFQLLKEANYDKSFLNIATEQLKIISLVNERSRIDARRPAVYENLKFLTNEECLSYYIAKIFCNKMQLLFTGPRLVPFHCPGSFEILPLQFFLKGNTNEDVKQTFEKNLNDGEILFVEMVNTEHQGLHPQELGKLRIIAKFSDSFDIEKDFAYHLNCNVFMFKNLEMSRLGRNEIKSSEVLKVCVLGGFTAQKRFITTNMDHLKLKPAEKIFVNLGIVSFEDMPAFLKTFKTVQKFSCYSNYLRSHPKFYHSSNLVKLIESLGIDPKRIYSFSLTRDGLSAPPGISTDSLIKNAKEAIHNDAQKHLAEAKKFAEKNEIHNAIEEFEKSANCWPDNFKVYELRGKMYLNLCKKRNRRGSYLYKAAIDFETALKLNPSAQESKQCLCEIFIYRIKGIIKKKDFKHATSLVSISLKINPENKDGALMLNKIEKRKKLIDVDAEDLQTLERRKELLQKKIKKEAGN